MGKTIGIDLGTTNSVLAINVGDKTSIFRIEDNEFIKSCVRIKENDEFVVGQQAYDNMKNFSNQTITSVKRLMGLSIDDPNVQQLINNPNKKVNYEIRDYEGGTRNSLAIIVNGKQYTPEKISSEILKYIVQSYEQQNGKVSSVVITVPAYFNEKQKNATLQAAKIAGLNVKQLLPEPTAAAISYGVDKLSSNGVANVLIYDFGGGTFDLSVLNIVNNNFQEVGTSGDKWLGGDDFDKLLRKYIIEQIEKKYGINNWQEQLNQLKPKEKKKLEVNLINECEKVKIRLSHNDYADFLLETPLEDKLGNFLDIELRIQRSEFENLIRPYIESTIYIIDQLLEEINYDMDIIDKILLVGGTSSIPLIRKMLIDKYGADKVEYSESPMLDVAKGAAILASKLPESDIIEISNDKNDTIDVIYVSNSDYLFKVIQGEDDEKSEIDDVIIRKQDTLPFEDSRIYKTTYDGQKLIHSRLSSTHNGEEPKEIFATIDEHLPKNSELIFNFKLNTNHILEISFYPKGKKNNEKVIHITRGYKNEKCYQVINDRISSSFKEFSPLQREEFFNSVYKQLTKVDSRKNEIYDPESNLWSEIEYYIVDEYDRIAQEDNSSEKNKFYLVRLMMAMSIYSKYFDPEDLNRVRELYEKGLLEGSIFTQFESSYIEKTHHDYTYIFLTYLINSAVQSAKEKNNINDYNVLSSNLSSIESKMDAGDFESAFSFIDNIFDLAKKYLVEIGSTSVGFVKK